MHWASRQFVIVIFPDHTHFLTKEEEMIFRLILISINIVSEAFYT